MTQACYEICYPSLLDDQGALCFPCDMQGHVDLNGLSPLVIENYLFARAMVGRGFALPALVVHGMNTAAGEIPHNKFPPQAIC